MIASRLAAEWRLKLSLTVVCNVLFWSGYQLLARHAFFPIWDVPLTPLDRIIPFQPVPWGWIYLSQFLFTGTLPWLLTDRQEILRCIVGLAFMSVISFAIFVFLPVSAPARPIHEAASMGIIAFYDGPFACFPSLHAGFVCYAIALAWRMFGRVMPALGWAICGVWAVGILYATIATRQHYALDLAAGLVLGGFSFWLAFGGADRAWATILWKRGSASQTGQR
jgi:membrane-associated phospholipid phosphatase